MIVSILISKMVVCLLQFERVKPLELAIDRPSPKFLGFLKKHYKLLSFVKQVMRA